MKKQFETTKTVTVTEHYCDLCGEKKYCDCQKCSRDTCKKHTVEIEPTIGDYSSYYCIDCDTIMTPYQERINSLEVQQDNIYDEMEKELDEFKESLK